MRVMRVMLAKSEPTFWQ